MRYYDSHLHTDISFDCKVPIGLQAQAARLAGLDGICVTDHVDLDPYCKKAYEPYDYDKALSEFMRFRSISDIDVRFGVELGVYSENAGEYLDFIRDKEYDIIVCSQHYIVDCDPYFRDIYFAGLDRRQAYEKYLLEVLRTIRTFDRFSVLGHLGYVSRYYPGPEEKKLRYEHFSDIIDEILKHLIIHGKGLEVNTKGVSDTGDNLPEQGIVRRYIELGGEIITVGSDAHRTNEVGRHIKETYDLLISLGATHVCTFKEMKPEFIRL